MWAGEELKDGETYSKLPLLAEKLVELVKARDGWDAHRGRKQKDPRLSFQPWTPPYFRYFSSRPPLVFLFYFSTKTVHTTRFATLKGAYLLAGSSEGTWLSRTLAYLSECSTRPRSVYTSSVSSWLFRYSSSFILLLPTRGWRADSTRSTGFENIFFFQLTDRGTLCQILL